MSRLFLVVILLLVLVGGAWLWTNHDSAPPATQTVAPPKIETKKEPWDGNGSRTYDVEFIHGAQMVVLDAIDYRGLNYPTATVIVRLTTPAVGGRAPSFLTPTSFLLRAPSGQVWRATMTQKPAGGSIIAALSFPKVPTRQLARQEILLVLPKSGGIFELGLAPPAPPAGHSFAEDKPKAEKKAKRPVCKKGQKSTAKKPCRKRA